MLINCINCIILFRLSKTFYWCYSYTCLKSIFGVKRRRPIASTIQVERKYVIFDNGDLLNSYMNEKWYRDLSEWKKWQMKECNVKQMLSKNEYFNFASFEFTRNFPQTSYFRIWRAVGIQHQKQLLLFSDQMGSNRSNRMHKEVLFSLHECSCNWKEHHSVSLSSAVSLQDSSLPCEEA